MLEFARKRRRDVHAPAVGIQGARHSGAPLGNVARWAKADQPRLDEALVIPPARARVPGFPVKLKELWVSLEDPEAFRAAIGR